MSNGIRRPPAVWITQTLVLIFALIWLSSLALNLVMLARNGTLLSPIRVTIGVSVLLGVVLLLLTTFWGLSRRRTYGKWLGVLSLVLLWITVLYIQLRPPTGPIKPFEYNSTAELIGASITFLFISALFVTLILRLAFAKHVDAFFDRDTSNRTA